MSSVTLIENFKIPTVFYTAKAWNTIQYLVNAVTTEIGWWQIVEKMSDGNYIITETIVPEQTVSGGEADISRDALAEAGDALMAQDIDIGKLLCWGHSHVNMGCTPSGQDVSQALEYRNDVPFLIRGIYNKKGVARVDILDFEKGIQYNDVANHVFTPQLSQEETDTLDDLITANVKTRIYAPYQHNRYQNNGSNQPGRRAGIDGYWNGGVWTAYDDIVTDKPAGSIAEQVAGKKNDNSLDPENDQQLRIPYLSGNEILDVYGDDADFYSNLDWNEAHRQ